jgi:hypothetical protein
MCISVQQHIDAEYFLGLRAAAMDVYSTNGNEVAWPPVP